MDTASSTFLIKQLPAVLCVNFEELRLALACTQSRPNDEPITIELVAGRHVVNETIRLSRCKLTLRGAGMGSTVLVRGHDETGRLFNGPLLLLFQVSEVYVEGLSIDGARFPELNEPAPFQDRRHPYSTDVFNPEYVKRCEPDGTLLEGLYASYEADILMMNCTDISLRRLHLLNAMENAIAVSRQCVNVQLEGVRVERAGQFGLWLGAALSAPFPRLPLDADAEALLPRHVSVATAHFTRCGASAIFAEAVDLLVTDSTFDTNHCDYPFQEGGGQINLDYKSSKLKFERCRVYGAQAKVSADGYRLLSSVGLEVAASDLELVEVEISDQVREAIHFDGSRNVRLSGCKFRRNNSGQALYEALALQPACNVSITTSSQSRAHGHAADDFLFEECEIDAGVIVWCSDNLFQPPMRRVRVKDVHGKYLSLRIERNMLGIPLASEPERQAGSGK
jgi:hypothetical protein